jgi:hypothetical protein
MMNLKLEFSDKEIRSCGGKKMLEGMGIDDII